MREGHTHKKKFHSSDALYPTILFPCPDVMCWFDILSTPTVSFLRFLFSFTAWPFFKNHVQSLHRRPLSVIVFNSVSVQFGITLKHLRAFC